MMPHFPGCSGLVMHMKGRSGVLRYRLPLFHHTAQYPPHPTLTAFTLFKSLIASIFLISFNSSRYRGRYVEVAFPVPSAVTQLYRL